MNINSFNTVNYANPYQTYKYYTRVSGLASGLDTDSIVQGLMSVERAKYNKLYQQQQILQWRREDYLSIANEIASFKDYLFNISLQSNFSKFKVSGDAITGGYIQQVSTSANTVEGEYKIQVKQLAKPVNIVIDSDTWNSINTSTVTLTFGD